MKKFIAGILASMTIIGSIQYYYSVIESPLIMVKAVESEPTEGIYENFIYHKYDDHIEIVTCNVSSVSVIIPDKIEGVPVTNIGNGAFAGCKSLTEITIPYSVVSIGDNAFLKCESLTEVMMPNSIQSIGNGAFEGCNRLKEINIPNSVTSIADNTFVRCNNLTQVIIPDNIKSIGNGAFFDCNRLTLVVIPDSVVSIGHNAFSWCENLTEIMIFNPECEIPDYTDTISNGYNIDYEEYFNGTIYGYKNSTAQAYAEKYNIKFIAFDDMQKIKGDANNDRVLDVADVVAVASYVGNPDANKLDERCIKSADVHNTGDGLTANDALMIQQYLAKIIENL